jgi:hypothetical protein
VTGEQLKTWMDQQGIRPIDLAIQLGITVPTVYKMMASSELTTMQALAVKKLMEVEK